MSNLYKASRQWSSRPDDERFATLEALIAATKKYADNSRTKMVNTADIRAEVVNGDVQVMGSAGIPAKLSHWSFGQLASKIGAPASYLRDLPATLAAQNLNHGLKNTENSESKLLFNIDASDGMETSLTLRSMNGPDYGRIWNYEIAERCLPATRNGWKVPPAMDNATRPSGLYAGDRDMFIFLVNENFRVNDGTEQGMARGMFIENSEVGAKKLRFTKFLYRYICGNHIVWGAEGVTEIAFRHVGDMDYKFRSTFEAELIRYANESASDDEARIASARTKRIAATKDELLDYIFGKRFMTRKAATAAYELAAENSEVDGDPRSVWGFAQGVTRLSQQSAYADQRTDLDRAAGKVLEFAF